MTSEALKTAPARPPTASPRRSTLPQWVRWNSLHRGARALMVGWMAVATILA